MIDQENLLGKSGDGFKIAMVREMFIHYPRRVSLLLKFTLNLSTLALFVYAMLAISIATG